MANGLRSVDELSAVRLTGQIAPGFIVLTL